MDSQQNLFKAIKPTIVMDKGIATIDNIKLLKEKAFDYILIERRSTEKDYKDDFASAKYYDIDVIQDETTIKSLCHRLN
jgi:transposase